MTPAALQLAERALRAAQQFIRNGIELGYIRMPDADCPDTAHQTPALINEAISAIEGQREGWRPISELGLEPGKEFLISGYEHNISSGSRWVAVAKWDADLGAWVDTDFTLFHPPTHWQPLPTPPQPQEEAKP